MKPLELLWIWGLPFVIGAFGAALGWFLVPQANPTWLRLGVAVAGLVGLFLLTYRVVGYGRKR